MKRSTLRLGLIGFGEVGTAFAAGLSKEGLARISAYDPRSLSPRYASAYRARAAQAGVKLVGSLAELADQSTLLLGVVPGSQSIFVARQLRRLINRNHTYVDLAAATPKVKQDVATILEPTGARIADGAIMSMPSEDGHRVVILASGKAAKRFERLVTPWGMQVTAIDGTMGVASGIKNLRSVFTKGLEALMVEWALACRRFGVEEQVVGSVAEWMDRRSFRETLNLLLVTDAIHAARRSREAAMSATSLREAGLDPIMTAAAAKLLRRNASLGLAESLSGVVPKNYEYVISMVDLKLRTHNRT